MIHGRRVRGREARGREGRETGEGTRVTGEPGSNDAQANHEQRVES